MAEFTLEELNEQVQLDLIEFSRTAAAVLNSSYFYFPPPELWAQRHQEYMKLKNEITSKEPVEIREDLSPESKKVFDVALLCAAYDADGRARTFELLHGETIVDYDEDDDDEDEDEDDSEES